MVEVAATVRGWCKQDVGMVVVDLVAVLARLGIEAQVVERGLLEGQGWVVFLRSESPGTKDDPRR